MRYLLALLLAAFLPTAAGAAGTVLFVAGDTTPPGTDSFIVSRLSALGFTVQIADDNTVTAADAIGKVFIFISETASSGTLNNLFRDTTIPIIVSEANLYDAMEMTGPTASTDYGNTAAQTSLYITDSAHYLADGNANTVTIYSAAREIYWGIPAPSAAVIAVLTGTPSRAALFAFETGQIMDSGFVAPARRIGFFLGPGAADSMSAAGQGMLDRAILWAAGASSTTPTPTMTPTWTATSTPTWSPTATPTWTETASPSWSPTTTPTLTETATQSVTQTWTPTATPAPLLVMQLQIEDVNGNLVRDLGSRLSYVLASNILASSDPFAPEDGPLVVSAAASSWSWLGDDLSGKAAPNGQYRLLLKQPGQADIQSPLWLRRRRASLGNAVFFPNPAKNSVNLSLQSSATSIEISLYSLAGELACRWQIPAATILATLELRSPDGTALASGLYLAVIRFDAPGGIRQSLLRKLAVIR